MARRVDALKLACCCSMGMRLLISLSNSCRSSESSRGSKGDKKRWLFVEPRKSMNCWSSSSRSSRTMHKNPNAASETRKTERGSALCERSHWSADKLEARLVPSPLPWHKTGLFWLFAEEASSCCSSFRCQAGVGVSGLSSICSLAARRESSEDNKVGTQNPKPTWRKTHNHMREHSETRSVYMR